MQDADRIQEQIRTQVQHLESKASVMQEQLQSLASHKETTEQELAKFRILRESFSAALGMIEQQLAQACAQEDVSVSTIRGFEGATKQMQELIKQAESAVAKNEGSLLAFQQVEKETDAKMREANARARAVAQQGERAVDLASRTAGNAPTPADQVILAAGTVAKSSAEPAKPAEKPIARPKKKASPKKRKKTSKKKTSKKAT